MDERVFLDKSCKPTEQALESALETVYTQYKRIMEIASSYSKDWTFTKSSGWMLKVYHKNKALFYLIPLKNEFKVSMAIRENEKDTFLLDDELKIMHCQITAAKKYIEGFALQFKVTSDNDCEVLELLINKLINIRRLKLEKTDY